ncbi:MAG: hypothetical protein H7343_11055 [Undibacterium sp.]|nr:hypothetical protein [Opitutaceae bacterium]
MNQNKITLDRTEAAQPATKHSARCTPALKNRPVAAAKKAKMLEVTRAEVEWLVENLTSTIDGEMCGQLTEGDPVKTLRAWNTCRGSFIETARKTFVFKGITSRGETKAAATSNRNRIDADAAMLERLVPLLAA